MRISTPSFAKINWILEVLGKRSDGYHEVSTVLQTIDLRDRLDFELLVDPVIRLRVQGREVARGADNLVYRAAKLMLPLAPGGGGVSIVLTKRIPVGAGLGGGSGNAATVLLALNRLWNCGLALPQLEELAAKLGSDVPFFLQGGTVWARGRGEQLRPLPDPPREELLLWYPGFALSTTQAYKWGKWPPLPPDLMLTTPKVDNRISRFCSRAKAGKSIRDLAQNDFDVLLSSRHARLAGKIEALEQAGCQNVLFCGSGSTLLGLGKSGQLARIRRKFDSREGELFDCRTLSRNHYQSRLEQAGILFQVA